MSSQVAPDTLLSFLSSFYFILFLLFPGNENKTAASRSGSRSIDPEWFVLLTIGIITLVKAVDGRQVKVKVSKVATAGRRAEAVVI
jgi:hypothetical protein